MKKILVFQSGLGKYPSVRFLLFFAALALQSSDVLAQDTMKAKIPQIELIPVRQSEVMDHFINKSWTAKGWQLETYNGAKEAILRFDQHVLIAVSPNQLYFTVAKPVTGAEAEIVAYNVELRNLANSVLAKGRLASLGSEREESHDEFMPADDGQGLVQNANLPLSGGLNFIFFKRKGSQLHKQFEVNKTAFWNGRFFYEPAQQMIVATFEGHKGETRVAQTHIQCFSPEGTLQWETVLDSQHVKSALFISAFDGTVSFVTLNKQKMAQKNLYLFDNNGAMLRQFPVYRGGVYKRSYYCMVDNRQFLLSPSDGEFYYVIDTKRVEIVNHQTQGKEGSYVLGVAMFQHYILVSYFTGVFVPGPDNTQEFNILECGLGIEDIYGTVTYIPLQLIGEPFLLANQNGLFVREKKGLGANETNKFYKVIVK